jgi:hypothetical protein
MSPTPAPSEAFRRARRRADRQADPNPFDSRGLLRDGARYRAQRLTPLPTPTVEITGQQPLTKTKEHKNETH